MLQSSGHRRDRPLLDLCALLVRLIWRVNNGELDKQSSTVVSGIEWKSAIGEAEVLEKKKQLRCITELAQALNAPA